MSKILLTDSYRTNTAVIIAAGAMLSGVAFLLFAVNPAMVDRFRLLTSVSDKTATVLLWLLPAVAAGIVFGGAALGILTFVRLVVELKDNPFVWLAPLLAIFSAFMISGVQFEMPITSINRAHFAVLSAFLLVGGGALTLLPRRTNKILGVVLCLFPAIVFAALHVLQHGGVLSAWSAANKSIYYVLFMLTITSTFILFIAFTIKPTRGVRSSALSQQTKLAYSHSADDSQWQHVEQERAALQNWRENIDHERQQAEQDIEQHYHHLQQQKEALRREREQMRREHAEAMQQVQKGHYEQLSDDDQVMKAMNRRSIVPVIVVLVIVVFAGTAAGVYFGWLKPFQGRMAQQKEVVNEEVAKQKQTIIALEKKLEAQQIEVEQKDQQLQSAIQAKDDAIEKATEAEDKIEQAQLKEQEMAEQQKAQQAAQKNARQAVQKKARIKARKKRAASKKSAKKRRAPTSSSNSVVNPDDDPLAGI